MATEDDDDDDDDAAVAGAGRCPHVADADVGRRPRKIGKSTADADGDADADDKADATVQGR